MYAPFQESTSSTKKWLARSSDRSPEDNLGSNDAFTSASCILTPSGASTGESAGLQGSILGAVVKEEQDATFVPKESALFPTAGSTSGPSSETEPSPVQDAAEPILPVDSEFLPSLPIVEPAEGGEGEGSKPARTRRKKRRLDDAAQAAEDDGFQWHKYGQKNLMEAGFMRAYYRCKARFSGCPAQKTVDRHQEGQRPHRILYSGDHNHPAPANNLRTVYMYRDLQQASASSDHGTGVTTPSTLSAGHTSADTARPIPKTVGGGGEKSHLKAYGRLSGSASLGAEDNAADQGLADMLNAVVGAVRARENSSAGSGPRSQSVGTSGGSLFSPAESSQGAAAGNLGDLAKFLVPPSDSSRNALRQSPISQAEGRNSPAAQRPVFAIKEEEETLPRSRKDFVLAAPPIGLSHLDNIFRHSSSFSPLQLPAAMNSESSTFHTNNILGLQMPVAPPPLRIVEEESGLEELTRSIDFRRDAKYPASTVDLDLDLRLAPPGSRKS